MALTPASTTLLLRYPASFWGARWREALPAGNGTIGAAVYGGVDRERVLLTHADLWWHTHTPDLPDVSDRLPDVRRLLLAGQAREADGILAQALRERGYAPRLGCPLPLGDLILDMPTRAGFREYARTLDMATGEIVVSWTDGETRYERALFISRTEDIVVCKVRTEGPDAITLGVALDLHDRSDTAKPFGWTPAALPEGLERRVQGDCVLYAARSDDGSDFGAVVQVRQDGGTLSAGGDTLRVTGAQRVDLVLGVFIREERQTAWQRLCDSLGTVDGGYDLLLSRHAAEHGRLFSAMTLNLHGEGHARSNEELLLDAYQGAASISLVEKLWAFGRYLLISSSREGSPPCSLVGLWTGEYEGFWAFNMANENLQMIYWQALSGNLPEAALAVFDYFDGMLEDFRTNARRLYNCRGIYVPGPTAPGSGLLKTLSPHIIHWTGGAGWIAQHYYDYYLFTGDEMFLRERALPFLREVVQFYQDFFITGDDGTYLSVPSNSPENTPSNYTGGETAGASMETTINATMDFAIAREAVSHLIEGARTLGAYQDELPVWEAMLARIPPYQINADGAVREWMHPYFDDNYHHRHQSHLYPVFPGIEVTRDTDPDLFEAFVTAVKQRLVIGLREQSGWSLAHMANVYARMGEGDLALTCLDLLSRSCLLNNFYTTHNDWRDMGIGLELPWAPFQIDANMGWTAAVQEMLLFSVPGSISVLPALPDRWSQGEVRGMRCRGGLEIDLAWDHAAGTVTTILTATRDQTVILKFPAPVETFTCAGDGAHAQATEPDRCTLSLRAGRFLTCAAHLRRAPARVP